MSTVALLSIDFQKGFTDPVWGVRNNLNAEENMALLLARWRDKGLPIIHIQHCSVEKNSPLRSELSGNEFKNEVQPIQGEKICTKTVNSAFIGTGLEQHLLKDGIVSLVIAGLTTDHCVSSSTRVAGNLGFEVSVVSDATATFDRTGEDGIHYPAEYIHKVHLASLHGEFCTVLTSKELLSKIV